MEHCRWAAIRRESQDIEELLADMRRAVAEVEVCPPPSPDSSFAVKPVPRRRCAPPWPQPMAVSHVRRGTSISWEHTQNKAHALPYNPTFIQSYNRTGSPNRTHKIPPGVLFIFSPKTSAMAPDRFGWKHTCVAHRTDSGPGMFLVVCSQPFPTADDTHTHVCLHVCVCGTTRHRSSDIRIPIPPFSGPQSLGRNSVSSVAGDGRQYTGWDRAVATRKP